MKQRKKKINRYIIFLLFPCLFTLRNLNQISKIIQSEIITKLQKKKNIEAHFLIYPLQRSTWTKKNMNIYDFTFPYPCTKKQRKKE